MYRHFGEVVTAGTSPIYRRVLAVLDRSALRAEAIGRCWSRGRFLAWLSDADEEAA
jgi:hypothetical protein